MRGIKSGCLGLFALGAALAVTGCEGKVSGGVDRSNQVDIFAQSILPILETDCSGSSCHSPNAGGAVAFAVQSSSSQTYQGVRNLVVPGNAGASPFINSMGADYASTPEWNAIKQWINEGAEQYGEPGSGPPPPEPVAYVGMDVCANFCHVRQAEDWLTSPHGNFESWDAVNSVEYQASPAMNNTGYPTVAMITAVNCAFRCHDNLGDGRNNLIPGFMGNRQRPVIGCEECHGAGGEHFNAPGTTIAYTKPAAEQCGKCHNATTSEYAGHDSRNPEGKNIKEGYLTSLHAASLNEHVMAQVSDGAGGTVPSTTDVQAKCSRCHTNEGARKYAYVLPTYDDVNAQIPSTDPAVAKASRVECRTCHNFHDEGTLLNAATVAASSEYNTCTHCHATSNAYHGAKSSYSWFKTRTEGGNDYYTFEGDRVIYDTHGADDPATAAKIEGYTLTAKSDRSCRDCHNQHSAGTALNREWAESAHGGHILLAKEAAADTEVSVAAGASIGSAGITPPVIGAGVLGDHTGAADEIVVSWAHYDWDGSSRQSCQRCHTATGFKNFVSNSVGYAAARNDFTHLTGWTGTKASDGTFSSITSSGQNELLFCWACHIDNAGGLRQTQNDDTVTNPDTNNVAVENRGKIAFQYGTDFTTGTASSFTPGTYFFPLAGKSNVCLGCHGARGNGYSDVKTLNDGNVIWNSTSSTSTSTTSARLYRTFLGLTDASYDAPTKTNNLLTAANAFDPSLKIRAYVTNSKYTDGQRIPTSPTVPSVHYLPSAATIFNGESHIGYEYQGADYANDNAAHGQASNASGPCISCHYPGKSHALEIVEKDGDGVITAIPNATTACNSAQCHALTPLVPINAAGLETYREGFESALEVLRLKLADKGAVWTAVVSATQNKTSLAVTSSESETFWRDTNGDGLITTDAGNLNPSSWSDALAVCSDDDYNKTLRGAKESGTATSWAAPCAPAAFAEWGDMGTFGAAHNYKYLKTNDPGAYMHNSRYAKRLVFDSIDWLDNGALDGVIDLTGSPAAAAWINPAATDISAVVRPDPVDPPEEQ